MAETGGPCPHGGAHDASSPQPFGRRSSMLTNALPVERGSHREARPRSSLLALALVVGLLLVGAEAWAWQTSLSDTGSGAFRAAAVDSAGNVIASGATGGDFTVVKLDGATGTELWRQT